MTSFVPRTIKCERALLSKEICSTFIIPLTRQSNSVSPPRCCQSHLTLYSILRPKTRFLTNKAITSDAVTKKEPKCGFTTVIKPGNMWPLFPWERAMFLETHSTSLYNVIVGTQFGSIFKKIMFWKQLRLLQDDSDLIRCGNHIHNAPVADVTKFPLLLPRHHRLTIFTRCPRKPSTRRNKRNSNPEYNFKDINGNTHLLCLHI